MHLLLFVIALTFAIAQPTSAASPQWLLGIWEIEWGPRGTKNEIDITSYEKQTMVKGTYSADGGELCPVTGVENDEQAFMELLCKDGISRLLGALADRPDLLMGQYSRNRDTDIGQFKMRKKTSSSGGGPPEQEAASFLKALYAHYGAKRAPSFAESFDSSMLKVLAENKKLVTELGVLDYDPFCQCQDPEGLTYRVKSINFTDPEAAIADIELRFPGGSGNSVRLFLIKEKGLWRVRDIGSKNVPSLRQTLLDENKRLASAQKPTSQPPTDASSAARPDAADCFMGECYKQFIVSKRYEGQTIIAEVRLEKYYSNPASTKPPMPAPTVQRYVAACGSPGYIQGPGGARLKQPEPDPPHSTRSEKQLWEAICGSNMAQRPTPPGPDQKGPSFTEFCRFIVNARTSLIQQAEAIERERAPLKKSGLTEGRASAHQQFQTRFRAFFGRDNRFDFTDWPAKVGELRGGSKEAQMAVNFDCPGSFLIMQASFFGNQTAAQAYFGANAFKGSDFNRFKSILVELVPGDGITVSGTAFYDPQFEHSFEPNHVTGNQAKVTALKKN
jgi:hypothetical protein